MFWKITWLISKFTVHTMDLDISWDEDLFGVEEKKPKKPTKQQPYNVKLCEKEYFFKNPAPNTDGLQKQNMIKFQADYWYQSGQYQKALAAYKSIHDNPQVSSTTVERDIDESLIRCHIKLDNLSMALDFLSNLIKKHGEDTALLLLFAEVCSRFKHYQGEIICLKKCISFHPYNHNFWYSLSKAYSKMQHQVHQSTNSDQQIYNMNSIMSNKIDEILSCQSTATRNFKDSLKLVVDCQHCECTNGLTLIDKLLICDYNRIIKNGSSRQERDVNETRSSMDEHLIEETIHSVKKLNMEDSVVESSTIEEEKATNEDNLPLKTKSSSTSTEKNKDQGSTTEELPCLLTGRDQSSACCSFNMTITKLSGYNLQSIKCSQQDGFSLLAFFCLLRTRFLLQRAIWTSLLFVKEKLCRTMIQVREDIDNAVLCQCDELKECILKQIESEDTDLSSQQVEELDMHALYQGNQKHWT